MLERTKERLSSFGYALKDGDEAILASSIQKAESTIKNDVNVPAIPEGLMCVAVDMAIGEFLLAKKTFATDDLTGFDLGPAIKQLQEGDTNTVFVTGEGTMTPEQRLTALISHLLTYGRDEFACYRRIRW